MPISLRLARFKYRVKTMSKVFSAVRLEEAQHTLDPATGEMTQWNSIGGFFRIDAVAEDYIEDLLGKKFGVSPFFLMNLTKDRTTWAAVFFTDIISDADMVLRARAELRDDLAFAAYGQATPGMANPPLGAMAVKSPRALEVAAERHVVFRKAWEALQDCSPQGEWVAIVDL